MTDHTARDALARELCQDRNCCVEGCYAGLRTADSLLASPALDAVVAERVAALAEDAPLVHDVAQQTSPVPFEQMRLNEVIAARGRTLRTLRALAATLRERGQSDA